MRPHAPFPPRSGPGHRLCPAIVSRILIAGCGYVGTEVGTRLAAAGHEVWGLRRDATTLPSEIRSVSADLLDPALEIHLPHVDRVIYAASADGRTEDRYRDAYVTGVGNLLAALETQDDPPGRVFYLSSTAVYGEGRGDWVDERTDPAPLDFRGVQVLRGEETVLQAGIPGVCLRLGGIYGPGRTRLLDRARSGELRCPPNGPVWSNRIHRADAAGALAHLLFLDDPEPVYLVVDEEPAPLCEVFRYVAALVGAPAPEVDPSMRTTRSNKRCSSRLLRSAGYEFRYPTFREGYRALAGAETS